MKMRWSAGSALLAVLLLVAMVAGCGGDKSTSPTPTKKADVTIEIVANNGSNSFSPNPATVQVGQTVAWHNAHSMTHTATANEGAFSTGNIGAGDTSALITMDAAGTFPYHCGLHPAMVGTLQVGQ